MCSTKILTKIICSTSIILFIGIPEVLELMIVPGILCFSISLNNCFLMSRFSIITSIIQSTVSIFDRSSLKFPVVILFEKDFEYIGDGFDINVFYRKYFLIVCITKNSNIFFEPTYFCRFVNKKWYCSRVLWRKIFFVR